MIVCNALVITPRTLCVGPKLRTFDVSGPKMTPLVICGPKMTPFVIGGGQVQEIVHKHVLRTFSLKIL